MNREESSCIKSEDCLLPDYKCAVCAGCSKVISDRYFLQVSDLNYHLSCLRCYECEVNLENQGVCYAKDGRIYCKSDYQRLFSQIQTCARCGQQISPKELIMRAKEFAYHVDCFTCCETSCDQILTPGNKFGLSPTGLIFCSAHFTEIRELMLNNNQSSSENRNTTTGNSKLKNKGRPRKSKIKLLDDGSGFSDSGCYRGMLEDAFTTSSMGVPNELCGDISTNSGLSLDSDSQPGSVGQPGNSGSRQKRVRTSFKHHQLRTMKSYFIINHNPDSKDLKQLSQKTGLNKRVLQVWFQNARAKYRKSVLKQQKCSSGSVEDGVEGLDHTGGALSSGHQSPELSDVSSNGSLPDFGSSQQEMSQILSVSDYYITASSHNSNIHCLT